MSNNQVPGTAGGVHIANTPLTTGNISNAAPSLLRNSIDERIVKIRPMSTPIDQLSRCGMSRRAGAMTVEYYSVDTKQTETTVTEDAAGGAGASEIRKRVDACNQDRCRQYLRYQRDRARARREGLR